MKSNMLETDGVTGTGSAKKRILLVDDHPLVGKGLASLLKTTGDLAICAEAGTVQEAIRLIAQESPDLVILDISLPGVSGLELLKDIQIRSPGLPVLVLSMHEENVYAERVLRAGAKGYIMKQEPGATVIEAIRSVLAGNLYMSPNLLSRMLKLFVSNDSPAAPKKIGPETLGDRELQVYTLIGNGFSTKEIASQLNLSVKTVQTYREHIKRKLGLRTATELVYSAAQWIKNGWGI